jgi:hypothetical protein
MTAARRFEHERRHLAIYEVETDDPDRNVSELVSWGRASGAIVISEALDLPGAVAGLYEPCSPVVETRAECAKRFATVW